ncbi:MAG TPA: hypothetical protein VLA75_10005 [Thermoanaerobaculia bacterium]|nr:hypothetical protein [Thermoanaerobaculia bacterium]
MRPLLRPPLRPVASGLLISCWMALLFLGVTGGGAVHLLLAGGLALFPWRELRSPPPGDAAD